MATAELNFPTLKTPERGPGVAEDAETHVIPGVIEELGNMNCLMMFRHQKLEEDYVVFNVAGKWVLTIFSLVISVGYIVVAGVVGYFAHPWLGYAHAAIGVLSAGVGFTNFFKCIWRVADCSRQSAVAAARAHELLGLMLMLVCLSLPLFQQEYNKGCLDRKRDVPTKIRDCAGVVYPHTLLLMVAFGVLLRFRPIWSTLPIAAFPLILWIGAALFGNASTPHVFWANVGIHALVAVLIISFTFILDRQDREKFKVMILNRAHQHQAHVARQQLDTTLEAVLPKSVLSRLSNGEPVMDISPNATLSVCEFYDFVQWSTSLLPSAHFQAVNALYSAFDEAVDRFGVEKLKAMGDRYVCASGLREAAFPGDSARVLHFGLRQLMLVRRLGEVISSAAPPALRIGVHTGTAVGVMIGSRSLSYEVLGRTLDVTRTITLTAPKGALVASAQCLEHGTSQRFDLRSLPPMLLDHDLCVPPSNEISCSIGHTNAGDVTLTASSPAFSKGNAIHLQLFEVVGRRTNKGGNSRKQQAAVPPCEDEPPLTASPPELSPRVVDLAVGEDGLVPDDAHSHESPYSLSNAAPHSTDSAPTPRKRNLSGSGLRHSHVRYQILLQHIKHRRTRQGDATQLISPVDNVMGRELLAQVSEKFARRTRSFLFSTQFVAADIQAAYREYLRRVDRDDGSPVMVVAVLFLGAVLAVVIVERAGQVAEHGASGIAVMALAVLAAIGRTLYHRRVIASAWEVLVLAAITVATYVAAGLLAPSVLNGDFQYLNAVFTALVAYNCVRLPIVMTLLVLLLGSLFPMLATFLLAQGRVPIELPIIAPLWLVSGLFMARDREQYHLEHFINASLSELNVQCAEDEVNLQRELLNMLFPRHAVSAIVSQSTVAACSDTVFVQKFADLCVLSLRLDGLRPLLRGVEASDGIAIMRTIEGVIAIIEDALGQHELLARVQMLGDSLLIVGPISARDAQHQGELRDSTTHPFRPPERIHERDDCAVGERGDDEAVVSEMGIDFSPATKTLLKQREDQLLVSAALSTVELVGALARSLQLDFSAILNAGSAFGAVMGASRLHFDVIGVATRQAMALMSAAAPRFRGATLAFKRLAESTDVRLPRFHGDCTFEKPSSWRVRGAGALSIFPLTWPITTQSENGVSGSSATGRSST